MLDNQFEEVVDVYDVNVCTYHVSCNNIIERVFVTSSPSPTKA